MSGVKKAKLWWQYIIFFFDWSLFEQLLLAINTIVSIIFLSLSIVLPDTYSGFGTSQYHILFDVVATIANFTNVVCIILVAKKHLSNYVWGFVAVVTLGIVAYLSRNTGTCILNLAFYTPMQVIGFIMWYKHSPNKRIIQPRQLNIYQWLVLIGIVVILISLLGWLFSLSGLQKFWYGSASDYAVFYYVIDASVLVICVVAMILMVLRYKEQWILWIIADVAMVVLFGFEHQIQMVISWSTAILNAVYGMWQWRIKHAKH